jgi:hypothetical protein
MAHPSPRPIPAKDTITGKTFVITELQTEDGEITVRGRFAVPQSSQLEKDQHHFLETFLRCRGVISAVEKELGISYPTVRARLDQLLNAMNLTPVERAERAASETKLKILDQLERGEISADEAKQAMRGAK